MRREVDFKVASRFLRALAGDAGSKEFVFQTFADRKKVKGANLTAVLHGSLADCADRLTDLNRQGAGVFVTINATQGKGRKAQNFSHTRAVWADLDDVTVARWPLEPSLVVETSPGKQHVYWLLEDDDMPLDTWRGCMARIVRTYGADGNATDPVRVLRLPGFFHFKGTPVRVRLVECNGKRYAASEIVKAFPPVSRSKPKAVRPSPQRTDIDIGALASALEHLAATPISKREAGTYVDDYMTWTQFGLALKRDLGEAGFAIWDEWSRFSDRYPGKLVLRQKWDRGFNVEACDRPMHVASIFFTAQRQGWSKTKYKIAKAIQSVRGAAA